MKIITDQNKLRKKSKPTTLEECNKLNIFNLLETTLNENKDAIGVCAIQIDIPIKACVLKLKSGKLLKIINPIIKKQENLIQCKNEGCLSLPNRHINTVRYKFCTVEWTDEKGNNKQAIFNDLEAIAFQHEIDHMEGILITDRQLKPFIRTKKKIGRNEKCPCGSGKKFKKCCLNKK